MFMPARPHRYYFTKLSDIHSNCMLKHKTKISQENFFLKRTLKVNLYLNNGARKKHLTNWTLPDTVQQMCLRIKVPFTLISSNLLIWVYAKANGELQGGVGGVVTQVVDGSHFKYLTFKSFSICSLNLRSEFVWVCSLW